MVTLNGWPAERPLCLVAALWLVLAVSAVVFGLRRAGQGQRALAEARAVADLLAGSPTIPALLYADGSLDADPRLAGWLGLAAAPLHLDAILKSGLFSPDLLDGWQRAMNEALSLGRSFAVRLPMLGTGHTMLCRGGPYAAAAGRAHAVLLWFTDVSQSQTEMDSLREQASRHAQAVDGLSALVESAPFPMWYRRADLSLSLVNGAYVSALEAGSAAEVVERGLELIDNAPRAGAAEAQQRDTVVLRTAPAIVAGERRVMRVVDVPVGTTGVAGYAIDVQEADEARTELALFVRAQRDMLDRLSAGVVQFASNHSLAFYNAHFTALFSLAPEWLRDQPSFDVLLDRMREAQRVPESRDFPSWRAERRAWFASAGPVEESWLLPGGTHVRVVAQPLPDRGLLLIFEDRTEHLRLASARDTLLRVRTATFDNLFEAIGVFAADGRLQLWNNRFGDLWGLSGEQLARHPRIDQLMKEIAPRLSDAARAGLVRDTVRVATHDRQPRSGRLSLVDGRHLEFAAVPLPDGNALFTLLDVTAARENEQALRDRNDALEEANRLKNGFVASMSYELRVPLTSITGFAEMLAGGYAGELPDTAREYVGAIVSAVGRLSALMGDLLDLTQSEIGSLPMEKEALSLSDTVRAALDRSREAAWSAALTLAADIAPDAGTIDGDRRRLAQAFDHLLRNAITFTPAGGRVLARVRREGMVGEVTLSDSGCGMTEEQIKRAFARLDSAPPSMAGHGASPPSRGFGLPLTRQLVEAHGGTLELVSEPGEGTTVTLRLPLAPQAASA
jgi:signal transduction histidine kinase